MMVWYEPSPGVRYAGVVIGPGVTEDTRAVRLVGAYWYHKGLAQWTPDKTANAISIDRLSPRTTRYVEVDECT